MTQPKDKRTPLDREQDNRRRRLAREHPAPQGDPAAKESFGPFGRGDREPQKDGKAPRRN